MHRAQVSLYACNRLQAYACSRHNGASECSKKLSAGAAVLVGSKAGALNQERCLQSLLALQHAHDSGNCLQPASLCILFPAQPFIGQDSIQTPLSGSCHAHRLAPPTQDILAGACSSFSGPLFWPVWV